MITNEAKKDPKAELQELATWIVVDALQPAPTCTGEEWDAVLEAFEEDCETAGACSTTLLINTTAQLYLTLIPAQKPLSAPPLALSKLRPKPAARKK
jgi:hypothetical protein